MEAEPIGFLFFLTILNWVTIKILSFHLKLTSLVKKSPSIHVEAKNSVLKDKIGLKLSKEEMEMVMERIGMLCNNEEDEQFEEEIIRSEYINAMFKEEEPSLEEVREAFDVFDDNCDGFIDALELQSVLLKLGFYDQGATLEECEGMIRAYDENGDGLIDCCEFVKFMERCFC